MNTPKTLAKIGSVYIEEAILANLRRRGRLIASGNFGNDLAFQRIRMGFSASRMRLFSVSLQKLKLEGRVQDTIERPNIPRRWSLPDVSLSP